MNPAAIKEKAMGIFTQKRNDGIPLSGLTAFFALFLIWKFAPNLLISADIFVLSTESSSVLAVGQVEITQTESAAGGISGNIG
jgi:hypothetical protein